MRNSLQPAPWRAQTNLVLSAITLLTLTHPAIQAQSHDVHWPAPLGQGVNKGNIDNKAGPDYYYFHAGPGHVHLSFAFQAMGGIGKPSRQTITFDLFTEDGKLISHNPVTSVDKLEQVSNSGDFDSYHRVTLRVMAPETALHLGGHYEIEITGAVGFGSLDATGSDAQPANTPPHKPERSPHARKAAPLSSVETNSELRITLAPDALFDAGSATIRTSAGALLHQAAALIREKGHGTVRIDVYADSKGDPGANLHLSEERAAAVKAWLVANEKCDSSLLEARGLSTDTKGRHNRQVELIVSK